MSERPSVVVHPAHHLPMDEARRARVIGSLTALLVPSLRSRKLPSSVWLDFPTPIEVSSSPTVRRAEGEADGK